MKHKDGKSKYNLQGYVEIDTLKSIFAQLFAKLPVNRKNDVTI